MIANEGESRTGPDITEDHVGLANAKLFEEEELQFSNETVSICRDIFLHWIQELAESRGRTLIRVGSQEHGKFIHSS
jgi:hypothetical protein